MSTVERSLALACERESAANTRAQNLEEALQATKEEMAAAAEDKAGLQEQIMEMLKQGRLREVRAAARIRNNTDSLFCFTSAIALRHIIFAQL